MKRYLVLTRGVFMTIVTYRFGFFFTLIGNLLYIVLVYFLWRGIYQGAETIRGMTFDQALVYLALASSIFVLLKTWTEWSMSRMIRDGSIATELIKPIDFQLNLLFGTAGFALCNLMVITLPSVLVLFLAFGVKIDTGIGLAFLPIALLFAFLISFNLDYMVGTSGFYTESLWGISMTKEIVTTLLSGTLVPLQFFPEAIQRVLELLPFQAIYHVPLMLITSADLTFADCLRLLGTQVFWAVALFSISRLFFSRALRVLTVSGG
jgi:ABC-2 type transport system permease protein